MTHSVCPSDGPEVNECDIKYLPECGGDHRESSLISAVNLALLELLDLEVVLQNLRWCSFGVVRILAQALWCVRSTGRYNEDLHVQKVRLKCPDGGRRSNDIILPRKRVCTNERKLLLECFNWYMYDLLYVHASRCLRVESQHRASKLAT